MNPAVRILSWNVHGWVGRDGRRDPERCLALVRSLEPEVVALQEVSGDQWEAVAERLGYRVVRGLTRIEFGNALLLRLPASSIERHELSQPGREERGALALRVDAPLGPLRIVTTHLGLRVQERLRQSRRLARILRSAKDAPPTVIVGDFNDWTPWAGQLRALARAVGPFSRVPTFPSRRPLLALDRAAWDAKRITARARVAASEGARDASDHLPLEVEVSAIRS